MSVLFPEVDFCVIDTETTGGSAPHNRIIDVAVFQVRDGVVVDKFQTLLNPERPIPDWITGLTGIDDSMVKNAPRFADIADTLEQFLGRGVFTAHNAPFDYAFVREEYARLGRVFDRPQLCTVRLARVLLPDLPSRSLGVLCEHLLIDIWDRHRAAGDAEATAYVLKNLLKMAGHDHGIGSWEELQAFLAAGALALPKGISHAEIMRLPESPGHYALKDEKGESVLVGKAENIRARIQSHFRRANKSAKANRLRELVRAMEFVLSADSDQAAV